MSYAHQKSRYAVIDPLYGMAEKTDSDNRVLWLYGEAELECWRLQVLREKVAQAKLKVGYPGEFHVPPKTAFYRHKKTAATSINFFANGKVAVVFSGNEICCLEESDEKHIVDLSKIPAGEYFILKIEAQDDIPALKVTEGDYAVSNAAAWEWSSDEMAWSIPVAFCEGLEGELPHRIELSTTALTPENIENNIYDFGREVFAHVCVFSEEKPEVFVGESEVEANNSNPEYFEQSLELIQDGSGRWKTLNPLAFRYVRAEGNNISDVSCDLRYYPLSYRGAFACSDETLTRIWSSSAYTLRLCMQDFIIDGVKRDRLPWVGDLAMSMMVNAYAFGDAEIIRRSLTALGRAGIANKHLNGIIDYSLWWVIAHDYFQLYFGDKQYLKREWPRIKALLGRLDSLCDSEGMLKKLEGDWLFIDWVKCDKFTALQVLWWWALDSAKRLAGRMEDNDLSLKFSKQADGLAEVIDNKAWDVERGAFHGIPGESSSLVSRHACFFSVISGLAGQDKFESIKSVLLDDKVMPVGTPYMAGFENIAISKLGDLDKTLSRVREYWGGMLEGGATTFWEAYDPEEKGDDAYKFYERPFGKSLCHAWSAGPAAFLPMGIFGIEPQEDGWSCFKLNPQLGSLSWAAATIPTPHGLIELFADKNKISLNLPDGVQADFAGRKLSGKVDVAVT